MQANQEPMDAFYVKHSCFLEFGPVLEQKECASQMLKTGGFDSEIS